MNDGERWLTVAEAATELGKSDRTVRRILSSEALRGEKAPTAAGRDEWRIPASAIEEYLADGPAATRPAPSLSEAQPAGHADADRLTEAMSVVDAAVEAVRDMSGLYSRMIPQVTGEAERLRAERDRMTERIEALLREIATKTAEVEIAKAAVEAANSRAEAAEKALEAEYRRPWWRRRERGRTE